MKPFWKKTPQADMPVSLSLGMHIPSGNTRAVYFVIQGLIAFMGLYGSVFTFLTACANRGSLFFSGSAVMAVLMIATAVFSAAYALYEKRPVLSRVLITALLAAVVIYGAVCRKIITAGYKYAVNGFLAALFSKFRETPVFELPDFTYWNEKLYTSQQCMDTALCITVVVLAFIAARNVKRPNILLFFPATFILPEICLYFGMVPDYLPFALLIASWCASLAAEITGFGTFADPTAAGLFTKTSAQSSAAAAAVMLISFAGAVLYSDASGFERTERMDNFRTGFVEYMKDFSFKKLAEDIRDAAVPPLSSNVTHDGKLGNTDKVEFSGKNMLEVTLPADVQTLYLKGFTGTEYAGSRWNAGPPLPELETKLSSPEFFGGRAIRYFSEFSDMELKNVIIRSTGMSGSVRYYPVNGAGLLETDGKRRRYGVYFPENKDWRDHVIKNANTLTMTEEMESDEEKLSIYAYNNCLDVPATFTAADDFFGDFSGDTAETLDYIREELSRWCEYDLEAGRKPFGSDFAQWFLTENKKGSCTHFASAAVLLCRTRGIPARYCEGFVIKAEDINSFAKRDDGYVTVSVPDNRAHAWAEIYADGYGWVSFEATPGYGNVSVIPSEDSDAAVTSEITAVITEAPVFSEIIETTVVEAESEISQADNTAVTTVTSVTGASDKTSDVTAGFTVTGAEGEMPSAPYTTMTESELPSSETASQTDITEAEHSYNKPEEKSGSLLIIAAAVGIPVLVTVAIILFRAAVYSRRKRRISNHPDKAAAEIYRLLLRLAVVCGVRLKAADELAAFAEKYGGTADNIIFTAEKARFGTGVSCDATEKMAQEYKAVAEGVLAEHSAVHKVIAVVLCMNKYV